MLTGECDPAVFACRSTLAINIKNAKAIESGAGMEAGGRCRVCSFQTSVVPNCDYQHYPKKHLVGNLLGGLFYMVELGEPQA